MRFTLKAVPILSDDVLRDDLLDDARPASTLVLVAGLASGDWLIEIEAIAAKPWRFYGDSSIYETRERPGI